jgi:site-specific DNA-methyltransferase (cytosine-N4-specific)
VIKENFGERFTVPIPMLLDVRVGEIALELKPYLQPFERELAIRELRALIKPAEQIREEHGYWLAKTKVSEERLISKLTYWQRLGRKSLRPTLQKGLEFTQNGTVATRDKVDLHRARRLRYGPHDLHEYRGKFFPQLVRSLINMSGLPDGAIVLDPMSGSGTTACEAVALGMTAIGADLNPLSTLIATVKAAIPTIDPKQFKKQALDRIPKFKFDVVAPEKIWGPDDLNYLNLWFSIEAINDLACIVSEISKIRTPIYRDFFRVCLSNIVRSVSWQKATDLRVRKEILPYESGTAQSKFLEETSAQVDRIQPYLEQLNHSGESKLDIRRGNAVAVSDLFRDYLGKVDLLITSPPYATALPYLDTDRLSLIVMGLLPRKLHSEAERDMVGTREISEKQRREAWTIYEARRNELPSEITSLIGKIAVANHQEGIGFRRRNLPALLGKYFLSMLDAMRSARELMKPGAYGYYVVGNNSTEVNGTKIEIPTDQFLVSLGAAAGWTPVQTIPMELIVSRDIFRENRGTSETILCFRA